MLLEQFDFAFERNWVDRKGFHTHGKLYKQNLKHVKMRKSNQQQLILFKGVTRSAKIR